MKLEDSPTDHLLGYGSDFHFFMPVESVTKSTSKDGRRMIQGIASTDARDLQGEIVLPNGIDYAYFLKHGYINDDHKDGPEHKVGEPTDCQVTSKGLWLKGFLYKGKERSDHWWEHINTLENSGSKRRVGFSIQGKVLRRDGQTIVKCWLQDVAITASPVNTNTWAEVVKSLAAQSWCLHPWDPVCKGGCCSCNGDEEEEGKALSAGGQGQVLMPESLEGNAKVQTFKSSAHISFDEAVTFLVKSRGYSHRTARLMADAIFATHGTR